MKYVMGFLMLFVSSLTCAKEVFPSGCQPIQVTEETVMLTAKKPVLILLHNLSDTDVWVTHPVSEPSASAGWTTRIQAGHWSALALQDKSFELSCIESQPGHEQQLPCADILAVCRWTKAKLPAQNQLGTYWAGEDMPLTSLTAYIGRRGFKLPMVADSQE